MICLINIKLTYILNITGDNNTLCITFHLLKNENHKSLPTVASMISKIKSYTLMPARSALHGYK